MARAKQRRDERNPDEREDDDSRDGKRPIVDERNGDYDTDDTPDDHEDSRPPQARPEDLEEPAPDGDVPLGDGNVAADVDSSIDEGNVESSENDIDYGNSVDGSSQASGSGAAAADSDQLNDDKSYADTDIDIDTGVDAGHSPGDASPLDEDSISRPGPGIAAEPAGIGPNDGTSGEEAPPPDNGPPGPAGDDTPEPPDGPGTIRVPGRFGDGDNGPAEVEQAAFGSGAVEPGPAVDASRAGHSTASDSFELADEPEAESELVLLDESSLGAGLGVDSEHQSFDLELDEVDVVDEVDVIGDDVDADFVLD